MFDHIGLRVADLGASSAFWRKALASLGLVLARSGAPGLRPDDFGAFLTDGDGNTIEAVCHLPGGA
jgi:catechol 2,3-dioxygenase-like lactoylglutathione lyase family enzyme